MHSVSAVSSDMDNGGEFSGWDLKSNAWDWESHLPLPSRLGGRSNEWSDEHADSISEISGRNGQGSSCVTVQRDYSMEQSHQHNSFKIKVLSPGVKAETAKEMEQAVKEHRNLSSPDLTNKNGDETVEKKKNGCPEDDETGGNLERKKLFLGLGGDAHDKDMRKDGTTQDAAIGLGLGKRTYFSTAGAAAAAVTANKSSAGSSSSGRKLRGSSAHVPRCQVEGCKADLSSSIKEYHRRHKVCAAHSKSAKVIVNGEEQRFCQQCSRFHALTAFDEGKRSCRRRLAGHNERRRKPQADALSLASSSIQAEWIRRNMGLSRSDERLLGCGLGPPLSFFGLEDLQQKMTYGKSNWPRFGNIVDDHTNHVPAALSSNISRSAERLLMVLPRKAGIGVHQFMQGIGTETVTGTVSGTCGGGGGGGTGSMGQTLSLSSPSPQPPGLYNRQGVSLTQASQQGVQQGNSDSSCALSLLSSQSWAAASTQPSLDGSQQQHPQKANSTVSISHLIADNVAPPSFAHQSHHPRPHHHQQHQQQQQQQQQQVYRESSYDKLITEGSQNQATFLHDMIYENNNVPNVLQESSSGFQGRLATIDLMNNPHSHSQCVDTVGVLKPYCSSIYNHHAM